MPQTSTVKEFVTALRTRESKTTKALTKYFTGPGRHRDRLPAFSRRGALNILPSWARRDLRALGLENKELSHINQWPNGQKEEVRKALVTAIENNRNVRFFWELHGGRTEETEVTDSGKGAITIVFRSPQRNTRVSTASSTFSQIMVDVAPRPKPKPKAKPRRRSGAKAGARRRR